MLRPSAPYDDAVLGPLERRRGAWRGRLRLAEIEVPLALPGGRGGPRPDAILMARSMVDGFEAWLPQIISAFRDEYDVGDEADAIARRPVYAAVVTLDRQPTAELGYRLPDDDDHVVGARVRNGRLVELNGSVLEP